MTALPRISFGIIVLNGEPFTRYCLRSIYPFAAEIFVVEGAVPGASGAATKDGHSRDGTLEAIRRFQREEDPRGIVQLITAEQEGHPDGFWRGEKDEMSRAYAKRATGQYLWQVDSDEFYRAEDMRRVIERLERDPSLHAVSFPMKTFWGGWDFLTDGWFLRRGASEYHRLFRWGAGFDYVTHRPPTVRDAQGRELRGLGWWRAADLAREGIALYHYSLLFPKQVQEKCAYYARADWARRTGAERWATEVFGELRRPFRVHNVEEYPSWLERFEGTHPQAAQDLRRDIESGAVSAELRRTDDIERLLHSPRYVLGRSFLKWASPWEQRWPRSWADASHLPARAARWLKQRVGIKTR